MPLKYSEELTKGALAKVRGRYANGKDPDEPFVRINVKVDFLGEHLLAARVNDRFTEIADEPEAFGGFGASPAPLHHFVTGFALSESSQYIWHIADMDLDVDDIELEVNTANFWTPGMRPETEKNSALAQVDVQVRIATNEPPERVEELCRRVGRGGPAHNSLVRPVRITSHLVVNGEEIGVVDDV
jgi:uncharacterized OsmC-like protein